jgi:hypothetical protein
MLKNFIKGNSAHLKTISIVLCTFCLLTLLIFYSLKKVSAVDANPYIVINEFSFLSSPDWVEIYNQSNTTVNLNNWSLCDLTGNKVALTGEINGQSVKKIDFSNRLDNAGDTIKIVNGTDCTSLPQDSLTYTYVSTSKKFTITNSNLVNQILSAGESAGRLPDGNNVWSVFSSPSPGSFNIPLPISTPTIEPTTAEITNTPTSSPTASLHPTSIELTPTITITDTPTLTITPIVTSSPMPSLSPEVTEIPSPTLSVIPSQSETPTPTISSTIEPTVPTISATVIPTDLPTPSIIITTITPTDSEVTPTIVPMVTEYIPVQTIMATPSPTATLEPTIFITQVPTIISSPTPTTTILPTITSLPTLTPSLIPSPSIVNVTQTPSPAPSKTITPTPIKPQPSKPQTSLISKVISFVVKVLSWLFRR